MQMRFPPHVPDLEEILNLGRSAFAPSAGVYLVCPFTPASLSRRSCLE